jgi:fructose-1-phosphate kinase PfkB-like protein
MTEDMFFALPAYPLETVVDPTGAGDTFAGGFVGYIARHLDEFRLSNTLRSAMAYGTALASFNVEQFGTEGLLDLAPEAARTRVQELWMSTRFELDLFEFATEFGRAAGPRSTAGVDGR